MNSVSLKAKKHATPDRCCDAELVAALRGLPVLACRLWLDTRGVIATVPMLRGGWGHCLHELDEYVYRAVFRVHDAGDNQASPRFVVRPAPPDPSLNPAVDVLYFGNAVNHHECLQRAWQAASRFGLRANGQGPRIPFEILGIYGLTSDGSRTDSGVGRVFSLHEVPWPIAGDPASTPCRLFFPTVTRLVRPKSDYVAAKRCSAGPRHQSDDRVDGNARGERRNLFRELSLPVLVGTLIDRVRRYHVEPHAVSWERLKSVLVDMANETPAQWYGEAYDLEKPARRGLQSHVRYGVRGVLELPAGPGLLWPLLTAGRWLHVGRGFVEGLGQIVIDH